jgi:hypothetical protein
MRRLTTALLLLVWAALNLAPAHTQTASPARAQWTILVYGAMDNDLEKYLFADIYEMALVGSTPDVNMVVQFDRTDGYDDRFGNWTDTRRFYIDKVSAPQLSLGERVEKAARVLADQGFGTYEEILAELLEIYQDDPLLFERIYRARQIDVTFDFEPLELLGEVDMGDPASLQDFVTWGMTQYPAERYMVIISSHGAGWAGIGPDYDSGQTILPISGIRDALRGALATTGVDKIDIVGFDACLMSQFEVATELQDVARYLLSAEEVIPGFGWEYTPALQALVNNPSMDAEELGRTIIDAYVDGYTAIGIERVDLHLLDLALTADLEDALRQFDRVIGRDLTALLDVLAAARLTAQSFGLDPLEGDAIYSSIDIKDFMRRVYIQSFDRTPVLEAVDLVLEAVDLVLAAVDAMVVYSRADDNLPGANGIAIYFPLNEETYNRMGATKGYAIATLGARQWNGFLQQFHTTIRLRTNPNSLRVTINSMPASANIYDPALIEFGYTGIGIGGLHTVVLQVLNSGQRVAIQEQFVARTFTIDFGDEEFEYVDFSPRDDNYFLWDGFMTLLRDGQAQVPVLLRPKGVSDFYIDGEIVDARGRAVGRAVMIYDGVNRRVTALFSFADNGFPFRYEPRSGDQFVPLWQVYEPDGSFNWVSSQVPFDLTFGTPEVAYVPALDGVFEIGVEITDLAGNKAYGAQQVPVINSAFDAAWRAFKLVEAGITFLYPFEWSENETFVRDDFSIATSVFDYNEDVHFITVVPYSYTLRSFRETVNRTRGFAEEEENYTFISEFSRSGPGYELYGFRFEYDLQGRRLGQVRLVYDVPANQTVYLIGYSFPAERYDQYRPILNRLLDTMTFFTPR